MGITDVLWGRSNLLICYEACLVLVNSSLQFKGMSIVLLGCQSFYRDVNRVTGMSIVLPGCRLCYRDVDCVTGMSIVLPGCRLCYWDVDCVTGMSIVLLGFRWCYWDVDCVTGMSIVLPGCWLCICRPVSHYCIVFNGAWQYTMIIHNNELIINYLLEVITNN